MRISEPDPHHRDVLGTCAALSTLPGALLDLLFEAMEGHVYAPGEDLIREGLRGDYLFLLTKGTAVATSRRAGGDERHIATFGPGEVVGEMALVMEEPRSASVTADSEVEALALPAQAFHDAAGEHPGLGLALTYLIADRLGERSDDGLGGKVVGPYRIRRTIARGSMGVAYEADHVDTGTHVALKMMSHRLLYEPGAMARFRQEADLLFTLQHSHVASFHERFDALKTSFIAMEFYGGPTIGQILKREIPLAEADVRAMVGQVASALHYLHARGIVHRDLKPDNMISDVAGGVHLIDFGLARDLEPDTPTDACEERGLVGTPLYMPPEQLRGHEATPAADVYALGCVALELLQREFPFDRSGFIALLTSKTVFRLPPAEEIGAGISTELHRFLTEALEPDPAKRLVDLAAVGSWAQPLSALLEAP